jgi:hypothetical protein
MSPILAPAAPAVIAPKPSIVAVPEHRPARPAPAAPTEAAIASAEAEKNRNAAKFMDRMLGKKNEVKPESKPAEVAKKEDPKPEAAAPKEEPKVEAKPEEQRRTPAKKAKPPLEEGDVSRIASAAATAAVDQLSKVKPTEKPDPKPEFSKADGIRLKRLEVIAEEFPEHKELATQAKNFYRKGGLRDQYRQKWEEANPDGTFDEEDEVHDTWFEKNDPMERVGKDELEIANEVLLERRAKEEAGNRVNDVLSKREQAERLKAAESTADSVIKDVAAEALRSMGFEEALNDKAKLASLQTDEPLAAHILITEMAGATPLITSFVELFNGKAYNQSNPAHVEAGKLFGGLESLLSKLPDEEMAKFFPEKAKLQFATVDQWEAMTPVQKRTRWTLGQDEVLKYIRDDVSNKAKTLFEKLKSKSPKPATQPETKKTAEAPSAEAKTTSPSISATTVTPVPGKEASAAPVNDATKWLRRMTG